MVVNARIVSGGVLRSMNRVEQSAKPALNPPACRENSRVALPKSPVSAPGPASAFRNAAMNS